MCQRKYNPVLDGFCFETESKRLNYLERYRLLQLLIKYKYTTIKSVDYQISLAKQKVAEANQVEIFKVIKRDGSHWRIKAAGLEINESSDLVGDCPNEFLEIKHEF